MTDRIPTKPGRVQLVPVTGQTNLYDMSMADEPTEAGTALNKANLLSDNAAAAVWPVAADRPSDPTVSQALEELSLLGGVLLADYKNTGTISSTTGETFTLADDIEKYKKLDIWIYATSGTGAFQNSYIYFDVGAAINSNKRFAQGNRRGASPNAIHCEVIFFDNSTSSHLVLCDLSRSYVNNNGEFVDSNVVFSASGELTGKSVTVSADSSTNANVLRIVIIGNKIA